MGATGTGADSLQVYYTGASSTGASQQSPALSLGSYRACDRVVSLTPLRWQPLRGIRIDYVAGANGPGLGTLSVTGASAVNWTPPGGTQGSDVTIANGETHVLAGGGSDTYKYIIITRTSATDLSGQEITQLLDTYNTWAAGRNWTNAEQVAGETIYQAIMFCNATASDITDVKVWLDSGSDGLIQIAAEAPVSGEITDIISSGETQQPAGLSWVHPTSEGTALSIGTLAAGAEYGLWRERIITADAAADGRIDIILNYSFVVGATTYYGSFRGLNAGPDPDAEAYELFVGTDALPDFTAAATETFTTLPHTTAALAADHDYYVATLRRNRWGVLGAAPECEIIRVAADGSESETPPSAPSIVQLTAMASGKLNIVATYYPNREGATPTEIGANRADTWLVYVSTDGTDPDPEADTPIEVAMNGAGMSELLDYDYDTEQLEDTSYSVLVRTRRSGTPDYDSTNTTAYTLDAEWFGPERLLPNVTVGRAYALHQTQPTADTTVYADEGENVYWRVLPGEVQLWADTVLVWRLMYDSGGSGRRELRTYFAVDLGTVSGAGTTDALEVVSATELYVTVNGARVMKVDVTNQTITVNYMDTAATVSTSLAEVPAWRKYAATCFQVFDPSYGGWQTAMSVDTDGTVALDRIAWTECADEAEVLT